MPNFNETPGLLFVVATLLPLASFLVLFLLSGLWALARRYGWEKTQEALGSEAAGKGAAYVAMGAIFLAFLCSLTGAVLFFDEQRGAEFQPDEEQHDHDSELRKLRDFARLIAHEPEAPRPDGCTGDEIPEHRTQPELFSDEDGHHDGGEVDERNLKGVLKGHGDRIPGPAPDAARAQGPIVQGM